MNQNLNDFKDNKIINSSNTKPPIHESQSSNLRNKALLIERNTSISTQNLNHNNNQQN